MKHLGDITKLRGCDVPPVDVITGGSPCQDFSVANKKRDGLSGTRSNLFLEQIRLIKEMREIDREKGRTDWLIRPRYMVFENVPGILSANKGRDFRRVLEETARVVCETTVIPQPSEWTNAGCIVGDGWSIAWRVHNAEFWGVAQRRERLSLVADFGGLSAPEILFERKGMRWDSEESGGKRERTPESAEGNVRATSFQERAGKPGGGKGILIQEEKTGTLSTINNQCVMLGFDGYNQTVTGERSKQLTSSATDSDHVPIVFNSEPLLSEKEKPQSEILCLNGQGGSSMYISNNVTGTLRAEMKGHEPILLEMQSTRHEVHDDGIAVTLRARMGTGGNNVDAILW